MLVLAHSGLTLGATAVLNGVLPLKKHFTFRNIDIRILLFGSLLPDFIDKPSGLFFFSNGRTFSHTVLFFILVTAASIYLYRRTRKTWGLVLSFGTLTHLILDGMWRNPRTLFWPLSGFSFGTGDLSNWLPDIFHSLLTRPEVYVPEIIGGLILLGYGLILVRRGRVRSFLRYGH